MNDGDASICREFSKVLLQYGTRYNSCRVFVALLQEIHREVGIFGYGINVISTSLFDRRCAPGADRPRDDRYHPEDIQGTPFEILAGEIFQGLPARPQIYLVGDLGISRHGCHLEVGKVGHQQ